MPKSRRRKKKTSRPSSGRQSYLPPEQLEFRPVPKAPTPDPPRGSPRRYRANEPSNYDHLPPLDKLVRPKHRPEAPQYQGPWQVAAQHATKAYDEIRDEVKRVVSKNFARVSEVDVDSRDTYLATKSVPVAIGDATDLYRYAKGNLEALQRAERLLAGRTRPTKWVTPGYHWSIDKTAAGTGRRETVQISLTVNAEGVAQLRCGDKLTPATAQAWRDLTATAVLKRPTPEEQVTPSPVRRTPGFRELLAAVIRTSFSQAFWFAFLLLALVVTITVIIVMALANL